MAQVPALRFGILTAFGSFIWDSAMALIGYAIGGQWRTVMKGFSDAGYLLGGLAIVAIAFVVWHRWRSYHAATSGADDPGGTSPTPTLTPIPGRYRQVSPPGRRPSGLRPAAARSWRPRPSRSQPA